MKYIEIDKLSKKNRFIILDLLSLKNAYIKYNDKKSCFNLHYYICIGNTNNKLFEVISYPIHKNRVIYLTTNNILFEISKNNIFILNKKLKFK